MPVFYTESHTEKRRGPDQNDVLPTGRLMALVDRSVEELRVGVKPDSLDLSMQRLYEYWLKLPEWQARNEALPLAIGVDSAHWQDHLNEYGLVRCEQDLWRLFAESNSINSDVEAVPVPTVYSWFHGNNVELPVSFARLFEFVRQATFRSESIPNGADETTQERSEAEQDEREIVLGAALSLVSKMPDRCKDEHGFIDGTLVSELILETSARWFASTAPTMTSAQMTELIDKWLE